MCNENTNVHTGSLAIMNSQSTDKLIQPITCRLRVNNKTLNLFVDTGADATLLTAKTWKALGKPKMNRVTNVGKDYSGNKFRLMGRGKVLVQFGSENSIELNTYYVPDDKSKFDIMGRDWIH